MFTSHYAGDIVYHWLALWREIVRANTLWNWPSYGVQIDYLFTRQLYVCVQINAHRKDSCTLGPECKRFVTVVIYQYCVNRFPCAHDDVMTGKLFLHYWPLVRGTTGYRGSVGRSPPPIFVVVSQTRCWTNSGVADIFRGHDVHVALLAPSHQQCWPDWNTLTSVFSISSAITLYIWDMWYQQSSNLIPPLPFPTLKRTRALSLHKISAVLFSDKLSTSVHIHLFIIVHFFKVMIVTLLWQFLRFKKVKGYFRPRAGRFHLSALDRQMA